MNFIEAFNALMMHEGGYSNRNPADDPGGETNHGVTCRTARECGYDGPMVSMPIDVAQAIAYGKYWKTVACDLLPPEVRFDVFDTAYNSGPDRAIKLLQATVGVDDDGHLGPISLSAINSANPERLRRRFNGKRLLFFCGLKNWDANSEGWARRVAANLLMD